MSNFKNYVKRFFAISPDYINQTKQYSQEKKDADLAMLLYLVGVVFLLVLGIIGSFELIQYTETGEISRGGFLFQWLKPIVVAGFALLFLKIRKQSIATLGLTRKNISKSLILAGFCGVALLLILVLLNVALGTIENLSFAFLGHFAEAGVGATILWFARQIIVVSFTEELLYRGFMGTRLYGYRKSKIGSIILVAFLFAIMHFAPGIPGLFMGLDTARQVSSIPFAILNWMLLHVLLHWMYSKHNNIAGPILFHVIWNSTALLGL